MRTNGGPPLLLKSQNPKIQTNILIVLVIYIIISLTISYILAVAQMDKLVYNGNGDYSFSRKADFAEFGVLDATTVQKTFDFAYDMTFGAIGQHREHRSGGTAGRKNGEIFADTFQGKLAEFAIYFSLKNQFEVSAPNLDKWALGKWDAFDLSVNGANVAIKSTKWFGQLLLLETEDWDEEGNYKPNGEN